MAGQTSFFYALFKRFQIVAGGSGTEHYEPPTPAELPGGFSLRYTQHPNGIFGELSPAAVNYGPLYPVQPGWKPLLDGDLEPTHNPLFVSLTESLKPSPPDNVQVNGQTWPIMPPGWASNAQTLWHSFNNGPVKAIDKFGAWIAAGKIDDAPKDADPPLEYTALAALPLAQFPELKVNNQFPVLFVASFKEDDGRRINDGEVNPPPLSHVPEKFWNTSMIFMTDDQGWVTKPPTLDADAEVYIAAIVGNAGNFGGGRQFWPATLMKVSCVAQAFNTHMSPGVKLPSLSNLDPMAGNTDYEQYFLPSRKRDVVGFRFDVNKVYGALKALIAADASFDLGGLPDAGAWLKGSHACVKVMITSGELPNTFPPNGGAALNLDSNPRKDRRIAQKNLVHFNMSLAGAKMIKWSNFMVSQAGAGANALTIQHPYLWEIPAEAVRYYLALPTRVYEQYVGKSKAKGFDIVREGVAKPFPDAVILRETTPGARLQIANHARQPFLGLSLGIEWDPAQLKGPAKMGDVDMIHTDSARAIVGGFTLQLHGSR